ncbi:MAG TPA: putative glycolipid-binding domain-containing protein [Conexibacter sp.]|nr:putative glycolipid-binding domain-containing protein [Conexibacter sp.]
MIWRGLDEWQVEAAAVELAADGLVATGTQIGSDPVAYRLDYRLDARGDFITRALEITVTGQGWSRRLDLRHDGGGAWTCEAGAEGDVDLPPPGCDPALLAGALDCDLGRSPLTNLMPIRRTGLDRRTGAEDFLMAWVSVPDLSVVASAQRYEHLGLSGDGSLVRYVDRGEFDGFTADLLLDADGFVIHYPELAECVGDEPREP